MEQIDVFPPTNLGPSDYWARIVENRITAAEKKAGGSNQDLLGINRLGSSLRSTLANNIESLSQVIDALPSSDSASSFNSGLGLTTGWTRVNTLTLNAVGNKSSASILATGRVKIADTGTGIGNAFVWPFDPDTTVTSEYGPRDGGVGSFHEGIDFGKNDATAGAPIHSGGTGVVQAAGYDSAFGNMVIVNHGTYGSQDLKTLYAHMSAPALVGTGANVNPSTVLGYIGNTGASQGAHLHWETHVCAVGGNIVHNTSNNGGYRTAVNPREFMTNYGNSGASSYSVSLRGRLVINSAVSREFEPFRDLFTPGALLSYVYPLHSTDIPSTSATVGLDLYVNGPVPANAGSYSALSAYGVFS